MEKTFFRFLIIFSVVLIIVFSGSSISSSVSAEGNVNDTNNQYHTFEYEKVRDTRLQDIDGNEILYIDNVKTVKVYERMEEVSRVSFTDESGTHEGYVSNQAFIEEKNSNLRIVVCLFILTTCAFITTLYFSFIKRHDY